MANVVNLKTLTRLNKSENLTKYVNEIDSKQKLSREEEMELFFQLKKEPGNQKIINKIVEANLLFVVSVAKKLVKESEIEDAINDGNIGLIKAIKKFNPELGIKFISYAIWWIRQAINDADNKNGAQIRLPANKVMMYKKIRKFEKKFEQENEYLPSVLDICDGLDISPEDYEQCMFSQKRIISLDAPLSDEESDNRYDVIKNENSPSPDEKLIKESLLIEIESKMECISVREAKILKWYYGIGGPALNLEEIAAKCNLGVERTRQLYSRSLKHLINCNKNRTNNI